MKKVRNAFDRVRSQKDFSEPKITDPSFKNMCDINVIMDKYSKTGMLPNFPKKEASFLDATQLPSFLEAHEIVTRAKEEFSKLPAAIRKACDHKIENFESFLQNPDNHDFCLKHGILVPKEEPKKESLFTKEDLSNLRELIKEGKVKTDKEAQP